MRRRHHPTSRAAWERRQARQELRFRRILVPLDFSGLARQALPVAVPLAEQHRATISLVHVVPAPMAMQCLPDGSLTYPVNTDTLITSTREHLNELKEQLLPAPVRGETFVRDGNAAYGVVSCATDLKADLIVLSTNGRSGLKRAMLGSSAERIVRYAPCSVLTVRRQQRISKQPPWPAGLPWRRILVPLDFSLTSLRALNAAVPLARQTGAELILVHVVEPNPYPAGLEGAVLVVPDAITARQAREQMPHIAKRFVPAGIRVRSKICSGRAATEIVATANEQGADLIVLAPHGHTGLDRLLLGSTAEQVVRHARCPVFVARQRGPHPRQI